MPRHHHFRRALPGLIAIAVLQSLCPAQGTKQDYERSASYSRRTSGGVLNERIEPNWINGSGSFWYRRHTDSNAHEFILVRADRATRTTAFDHADLAARLSKLLGRSVPADRLPLDDLRFETVDGPATFSVGGKAFALDLKSRDVKLKDSAPAAAPNDIAQRPSRTSTVETSLTFINQSGHEVKLFWIDTSGRRKSYGVIPAGETREQHTFVDHAWLVTDADGKPLASFVGKAGVERAVISPTAQSVNRKVTPSPESPDAADVKPVSPPATRPGGRRSTTGDTSPDRRYRASIRDFNVVVRDTRDGSEMKLTTDGADANDYSANFNWSPDSTRLMVMQTKRPAARKVHIIESSPKDQVQPNLITLDYVKPGDEIDRLRPRLFDLVAGKRIEVSEELFDNPWRISDMRWAADSSRFTFVYNQRGHQVLRTVAVSRDGAVSTLFEDTSKTFIDYSGKFFSRWIGSENAFGQVVWMSERSGWNHLYLIDGKSGAVVNPITTGPWVVRQVERIDMEKRQVWFTAMGIHPSQDPYHVHLCRANLDGTGLTILTEGDGTHRWVFSPDNRYLLATWSRVDQPPVTELRNADTGKLVCDVEKADASGLKSTGYTVPRRFVAKGRDGKTDIHGIIVLPSNFDPDRKYPVVEQVYAGPQGFFTPKEWGRQRMHHQIAELGFIVVQMDGMGTNWRSKAFHDVCYRNLADGGFPDRILWMKAAAKEVPQMDLSRIGIFGGSAGGQNALAALLHHGDFYKVAVADCGCHDNRMDKIWWNEQWMGWPVGKEYAESSNVTHAGKLAGKLLLIVGELDRNVDPASTMQVVNALVKANRDFEFLPIPGAGHGAAETPYGSRRRADFLVRHLLGVEPRWEK